MTLSRSGHADAGSLPQSHELLIIARARAEFFSVVQRFPDAASLEVHLDRRRGQRRRSADPAAARGSAEVGTGQRRRTSRGSGPRPAAARSGSIGATPGGPVRCAGSFGGAV